MKLIDYLTPFMSNKQFFSKSNKVLERFSQFVKEKMNLNQVNELMNN